MHEKNTNIFARAPDGSHFWSIIVNLAEIEKVNLQSQRYKRVHKPIMSQDEKDSMITNIE